MPRRLAPSTYPNIMAIIPAAPTPLHPQMYPPHPLVHICFGPPPPTHPVYVFIEVHEVPTADLVAVAAEHYPSAASSVVAIYEDGSVRKFSNLAPPATLSTVTMLKAYLWTMLDALK